jgi:hypothetical protein
MITQTFDERGYGGTKRSALLYSDCQKFCPIAQ